MSIHLLIQLSHMIFVIAPLFPLYVSATSSVNAAATQTINSNNKQKTKDLLKNAE